MAFLKVRLTNKKERKRLHIKLILELQRIILMLSHYIPTKLLRVRAGSFANCTVQIKRCTYLAKTNYFSCA